MVRTKRVAFVSILALVFILAAPASAVMFHGQSLGVGAEKAVEFADRAEQRVQDLIDLVNANVTALTAIEDAGLLEQFDGNVTLFGYGAENVTAAYIALEAEDYEGAIANATQALQNFREVFRSIHIILRDSGVQKGEIVDAQGLLVAMRRSLERIEQLRTLLPENAMEALGLLDNATNYLDIDVARVWLLEGNVSETAHNLTQANQLISQVHRLLVEQAKKLNTWRMNNYLRGIFRTRERMWQKFQSANTEGVDVDAVLQSLGYQNMTEFMQTLQNMTDTAQGKIGDIKDTIHDLKEIGRTMREMDLALTQEIWQYRHGNNGMGSGHGGGMGGNP
jgi:tetratricopeptide (TPR) repeat protein